MSNILCEISELGTVDDVVFPEDEGDQRESRSGCESENEEESRLGGAETVFG